MTSTQTLIDTLQAGIPTFMQAATVPGVAITLIRENAIVWSQGFGVRNRATHEPVTLDTVFEAASLSKPVFAYAALKLCEKGVLDLDTPLAEYISERSISVPIPTADASPTQLVLDKSQLEQITLRHVLSHTTGFPNWASQERPLKPHFTPGERFSYSGVSYSVLQTIVEIVTGQPAIEYVQASVLEPFGMQNSRFVWTGQEDLPVALGHDKTGKPSKKSLWREMIAGASLHGTSHDYARFLLAVMQPAGDTYHLESNLSQEMLTPQIKVNDSAPWHDDWPKPEIKLNESVSWGLGWGIQHHAPGDSFWHWGDNGNYQNFAMGSRHTNHGVVIMTNGKNGQRVYRQILWEITGGNNPGLDWLVNS
jgi:CubicO group peptidase (beta-lactamase class C family)